MSLRSPRTALLTLSLLLGGAPAFAATQLDTARTAARGARAQLVQTRAQQQTLRGELTQVSRNIEAMKAGGQSFLTNPELDAQLRRSQELSASMTELAQSAAALEAQSQASAAALLTVLNDELNRLRAQLERSEDRGVRKTLISQLRALRDEREQVRAQLPANAVPALNEVRSDDPEELLEQADALRDNEDKLRSQMKQLQARVQEAKDERELDRSINNFSRDDAMFDDQDRRLRLSRSQSTQLTVERAPPLTDGFNADSAPAETTTAASGFGMPQSDSRGGTDPQAGNPGNRDFSQTARASDALPQIGKMTPGTTEDDNVETLEAQLKRLQRQADELKARADELEKKAQDNL